MNLSNLFDLNQKIKYEIENNKTLVKNLNIILNNYNGSDWINYIKYNDDKYNKIYVYDEIEYEMVLICWKKGQKSNIHCHPEKGCLMKILQGQLVEIRYDNDFVKENILSANCMSYIEGKNGLHSVDAIDNTVSLHIYSPPHFYI